MTFAWQQVDITRDQCENFERRQLREDVRILRLTKCHVIKEHRRMFPHGGKGVYSGLPVCIYLQYHTTS